MTHNFAEERKTAEENYNKALNQFREHLDTLRNEAGKQSQIVRVHAQFISEIKAIKTRVPPEYIETTKKLTQALEATLSYSKSEMDVSDYLSIAEETNDDLFVLMFGVVFMIGILTMLASGMTLPLMFFVPVIPVLIISAGILIAGVSVAALGMGGAIARAMAPDLVAADQKSSAMVRFFNDKNGYKPKPETLNSDSDDESEGYDGFSWGVGSVLAAGAAANDRYVNNKIWG